MWKRFKYSLFLTLTLPLLGYSQGNDTLYIENCYKLLYQNWPTLKNDTLYSQSCLYKTKNISSAYLPQIGINAQATYQSDVTSVNLPFPGIKIDSPSKDQYKATLDVNQLIFDAGLTNSRKKLESSNSLIDKQQIVIDINSKKEQLNSLFFNIMLLQETENLQFALKSKLQEKLLVLQSGVTNGIITESELFTLQAELLKIDQQIIEIKTSSSGLLSSLSKFIGQEIPRNIKLGYELKPFEFTENIYYSVYGLTIKDVGGKLLFAYRTSGTKYECKIGVVEGCAIMLEGANDKPETRNIPLGEKDKKAPIVEAAIATVFMQIKSVARILFGSVIQTFRYFAFG